MISCSVCGKKYPSWRTLSDGRKASGFDALRRHFEYAHEAQFNELQEKLDSAKHAYPVDTPNHAKR